MQWDSEWAKGGLFISDEIDRWVRTNHKIQRFVFDKVREHWAGHFGNLNNHKHEYNRIVQNYNEKKGKIMSFWNYDNKDFVIITENFGEATRVFMASELNETSNHSIHEL